MKITTYHYLLKIIFQFYHEVNYYFCLFLFWLLNGTICGNTDGKMIHTYVYILSPIQKWMGGRVKIWQYSIVVIFVNQLHKSKYDLVKYELYFYNYPFIDQIAHWIHTNTIMASAYTHPDTKKLSLKSLAHEVRWISEK